MRKIYLDYNASTPIAAEVAAAMQPFINGNFGNPSSGHWASEFVKPAIDRARGQIADTIGSKASEIVFTSSGTEASNLAIKGLFFKNWGKPFHIITSAVEHAATLAPCRFVESLGAELSVLPVDEYGRVDPGEVEKAIRPSTKLVSIMHAQNEIGTVQPISEIGKIARSYGVCMHVDAAQSLGKIAVDVNDLNADLLSITGQKIYAPKGVGALFVRDGVELSPLLHGPSAHEGGLRSGTESALLNVALGTACSMLGDMKSNDLVRIQELRDRFYEGLLDMFGKRIRLNGHTCERLPNTLNVSFCGKQGYDLLGRIPNIAASTGSACHSGSSGISPTLAALGVPKEWAQGAIRFSLGRGSSLRDVDEVLELLANIA
ncbi:cysteine desulfurase [Puniceicoccaceae bacterium K14]|nr:cysteine desulfurase [Puniceicoccaceae bacterium K14]